MEIVTAADGGELACWRSGDGPPLLLVHGSISDRRVWDAILPRLEERFTVHRVNRRGREGSTGLEGRVDLEREFRDVAAVVDAVGGPVAVLGHSFGALCALGATFHTRGVGRLLLFEPPQPHPALARALPPLRKRLDAGQVEAALEFFLSHGPGEPPENIALLRRSPLWPTMLALTPTVPWDLEALAGYEFRPETFGGLPCPVRYLLGSKSPAPFRAIADALAPLLPDFDLVLLEGEQHMANVLGPDLFASEVVRLLSE